MVALPAAGIGFPGRELRRGRGRADRPGGNPGDHRACGHIAGDDGIGTDGGFVSYRYAAEDGDVAADPDLAADPDRPCRVSGIANHLTFAALVVGVTDPRIFADESA